MYQYEISLKDGVSGPARAAGIAIEGISTSISKVNSASFASLQSKLRGITAQAKVMSAGGLEQQLGDLRAKRNSAVSRAEIGALNAQIRQTERELRKLEDLPPAGFVRKLRESNSILKQLAVGAAAFGTVSLFRSSVEAASSLNETLSKSREVFQGANADIISFAQNSAVQFGLSRDKAIQAAATFGQLGRSLGMTGEKASDMSKPLVKLAADLASFNNTSVEDAIAALRSGLVGEIEPMRRYGVFLNETIIKAEAKRLGLVRDTKGVLDPLVKLQATYSVIMRQTATAQGDFARTSDQLANSQRIAAAELENAQAKMGEVFIPIMTRATQAVTSLVQAFGPVAPQAVVAFGAIAAGSLAFRWIGPIVRDVRSLGAWIVASGRNAAFAAQYYGLLAREAYATGGAVGVLRAGFSALRTAILANPIGWLVGGLAAVGAAVYTVSRALSESNPKQRLANELNKRANELASEEVAKLNILVATARNEKLSKEQRLKAIKELNQASPEYLGNLTLETINTDKATQAIDRYVASIKQKALVQAGEE